MSVKGVIDIMLDKDELAALGDILSRAPVTLGESVLVRGILYRLGYYDLGKGSPSAPPDEPTSPTAAPEVQAEQEPELRPEAPVDSFTRSPRPDAPMGPLAVADGPM